MKGATTEKLPNQIADVANNILYTFGESSIEVDFVTYKDIDDISKDSPFARVKTDPTDV